MVQTATDLPRESTSVSFPSPQTTGGRMETMMKPKSSSKSSRKHRSTGHHLSLFEEEPSATEAFARTWSVDDCEGLAEVAFHMSDV
mmetsp:Transcript_21191/g.41240  ORF Transcript_21191/g.41240 Transcript_21191/m.41240 type:complete len:86 (+) Transcript_21191:444-701(+)|eukprot:CAMPEP_0173386818 /NCGR_PEP_ID=MMETSP1356-20130122/9390_1 /TAXON_ID=77927 ORGANISM="Hemiselmis virescens, Strain PCC157" /NCGR_SAMPLE_ID=MMETSP1356 /ASSEMBLY_ACC=CAM_ASM_000847 /LENGTH=85 /DNA_ID=CAMNT_0014343201 /DNA_START=464 /DNA_END=721 /DNA_ORIENTATION=+